MCHVSHRILCQTWMWWSCHCLHISITGGCGIKSSGRQGVCIPLLAGTGTGVIMLPGRDAITTPLGLTNGRLSAEFMAIDSSSPFDLFLYRILCKSSCLVMIGRLISFLWSMNKIISKYYFVLKIVPSWERMYNSSELTRLFPYANVTKLTKVLTPIGI